jgi:trigger factor
MARMETQVEELADNRVRLQVEVGSDDVRHAVEHAASDLAETVKIPGFRKGRVPMPVLVARVGRERLYAEAVESHIGGWFRTAAARSRIRPVDQPEFGYDPPASADESFRFTATVAVQPKPELPDWRELEVPYAEPEVPVELVDQELEALRSAVAELVPVEDRPVAAGDTLVVDLVGSRGEAHRDYVVELGQGRLLDELEAGLVGMPIGETKTIEAKLADGSTTSIEATVKEIKEKVLPALDDDLARSTSEFETLAELREDIEARLRAQLEVETEAAFRQEVVRALADAAKVEASGPLVEARARTLLQGLALSLERRGISLDTYLQVTDSSGDELVERLRAEARESVAGELALEAAADQLGVEVSDEELEAELRRRYEDADEAIPKLRESGRWDQERESLRLARALDRVASEVKRIPADLAAAREKLWTPEKERDPAKTTLWTPASKEPAP